MKSSSSTAPRRWQFLALRVAILAVTFAAGWYLSAWNGENTSVSTKNIVMGGSASAKHSTLSASDAVAQVKAAIAKLGKVSDIGMRIRKIADYIAGLDNATIKALVEDSSATALLNVRSYAREPLIMRWAELDHAAALAWALKYDNDKTTLRDISMAWSASDPAGALAALSQLQLKGEDYSNALQNIIDNYFEKDPAAAYTALRNLPLSQTYHLYAHVFQIWTESDPVAASTAALNLPPSKVREQVLEGVANGWALTDPTAALAWVNALPAGAGKNEALTEVVMAMSEGDPAGTAAALASNNIPLGYNRDNVLESIASGLAEKDPAAALQWADKNLTGKDYETAMASALETISNTDPAAAAADLAKISDPGLSNQILQQSWHILDNWAQQDPQAALAWAQALPADDIALRNTALAQVFSAWIITDPAAAGNYVLQNMTTDPSFSTLAKQVANNMANSDPQGAFTWAVSLPPGGGTRINAITTALGALTMVDPQAAWQDAQTLTGGNNAPRAEAAVISVWANQQPVQAAAALQNIPEGSDLNTATGNVAKSWLAQDPNAASQWINTLPQGSARDAAVTQIIATVGSNDPASAFNWAVSIGDATTRNNQVVKLATQWSSSNAAAAATAAQNALGNLTGLTPAQQTALQNIVAKAPAP